MKKLLLALLILLTTFVIESFSFTKWEKEMVVYDVAGYYMYLPAVFIFHDLSHLDYYSYVDDTYHPTPAKGYAIFPQEKTGRKVIKYPMGVAIGEMPLFLVAHAYALLHPEYKPDGYTTPYKVAIVFSTILWTVLGLFFLGRFLIQYYNSNVAALVVLIIGGGTNLFAYTVVDVGMSHAWLFLLFAALLFCTQRLFTNQRPGYFYPLGALLALATISRPTDIVIAIVPLIWMFPRKKEAPERRAFLLKNRKHFIGGVLVFIAVLSLQLGYWKYMTGNWLHFSYEGEGFDFAHPHILDGLFSYRKGWFLYTPVALIGMLGLIPLYYYDRKMSLTILLFFTITIYLVFSWIAWFYGWSFGCRALIEALAVLSIPIGAIVHYVIRSRSWLLKSGITIVFGFFIWLNIYQSHQYERMVLMGDYMTKEYYWRIWNKMQATDEDRKYLK